MKLKKKGSNHLVVEQRKRKGKDDLIHIACKNGNYDEVERILDVDPNLLFSRGQKEATPLFKAVSNGHFEVACLLVTRGGLGDPTQNSGLMCKAAERGLTDIVKLLLDNGLDIEERSPDGRTPLHCAVEAGKQDTIAYLCQEGADIEARSDAGGYTALHEAVLRGNGLIVDWMLQLGANIDAVAGDGESTAFDLALLQSKRKRRYDFEAVAEALELHRAEREMEHEMQLLGGDGSNGQGLCFGEENSSPNENLLLSGNLGREEGGEDMVAEEDGGGEASAAAETKAGAEPAAEGGGAGPRNAAAAARPDAPDFCSCCGARFLAAANFCAECGAARGPLAAPPSPPQAAASGGGSFGSKLGTPCPSWKPSGQDCSEKVEFNFSPQHNEVFTFGNARMSTATPQVVSTVPAPTKKQAPPTHCFSFSEHQPSWHEHSYPFASGGAHRLRDTDRTSSRTTSRKLRSKKGNNSAGSNRRPAEKEGEGAAGRPAATPSAVGKRAAPPRGSDEEGYATAADEGVSGDDEEEEGAGGAPGGPGGGRPSASPPPPPPFAAAAAAAPAAPAAAAGAAAVEVGVTEGDYRLAMAAGAAAFVEKLRARGHRLEQQLVQTQRAKKVEVGKLKRDLKDKEQQLKTQEHIMRENARLEGKVRNLTLESQSNAALLRQRNSELYSLKSRYGELETNLRVTRDEASGERRRHAKTAQRLREAERRAAAWQAAAADAAAAAVAARRPLGGGTDRPPPPPARAPADDDDAPQCVICLVARRTAVLLPCRHMCLCDDCAERPEMYNLDGCPICREPIYQILTSVFY